MCDIAVEWYRIECECKYEYECVSHNPFVTESIA